MLEPICIAPIITKISDTMSVYFAHTDSKHIDDVDAISYEELDITHPRGIITFYNGFDRETLIDRELSSFNTTSMITMLDRYGSSIFNPKTREILDNNQIKRILWYKECLQKFPTITRDDILDCKNIIDKWITKPLEIDIDTDMCKYFVTYEQIINYFGFSEIDSREKAMEYFESNPSKTWAIRKSSVTDSKYNQFFVIMYKKNDLYENALFVHRQGYGIMHANSSRGGDISNVTLYTESYFTNIIELLIHYIAKGIICL